MTGTSLCSQIVCTILKKTQQYALICTTPLFYVLAPACFCSSLPSSGSVLDPSELLEVQIGWVVCYIMCGYVTCEADYCGHNNPANGSRNHTLYDVPPTRSVLQVTQKDLRRSLMMAGYCRNMQEPIHTIKEWYISVYIVGFFLTCQVMHGMNTKLFHRDTWRDSPTHCLPW
jgi:hypothetical protein